MPAVERRDSSIDSSSYSIKNPVYIAGVCIIGVVVLSIGIWLARRFYIRRRAAKDIWFLSVKGLVSENSEVPQEKVPLPSITVTGTFSRKGLDSTITLPEKTLSRPRPVPATRDEIIDYHRQSGAFPQSFSPKPFSFALSANGSGFDSKRSSKARLSVSSSLSGGSRYSVISVASSNRSFDAQSTIGAVRKVRQLFEPVLPDELLLTKVGEQLTIVQSFDDGWCVVGRESSPMVNTAKSLFKTSPQPEGNVELGVVPAWCFIKPMQGVRVERPVRSTSLGITVNVDGPSSRSDLISWSNF